MSAASNAEIAFVKGVKEVIDTLGGQFEIVAPDDSVRAIDGVITTVSNNDAQLVNAVGIEAKVFYCYPMDPLPQKLDRVRAVGEVRGATIQAVHVFRVNNNVFLLKMALGK